MAEIRIERKDAGRRRLMKVLLPLLAVVALAAFFLTRGRGDAVAARDTTTAAAAGAVDTAAARPADPDPTAAVASYTSFVGAGQPDMADSSQLRYASDGVLRLADALEAVAGSKATPTLTAALTTMRAQAQQLPVATGTEPTYMEIAKPGFMAAATALTEVQRARGAGDVAQAVKTAESLTSRGPLRTQREKIQNFFDQAATGLQTILGTPGITPAPDSGNPSARMDSLRRADSLRLERVKRAGGDARYREP